MGAGLYFYFYFLKFFSVVFLLIFIISLAPLFMNYNGNGLANAEKLLSLKVGNSQKINLNENDVEKLQKYT